MATRRGWFRRLVGFGLRFRARLTRNGEPKITDFGLAKHVDADAGLTRANAIMGTPSYMAPEQAAGRTTQITPRTDVYALGAILYELLTGRPPFKGEDVWETLDQVRNEEPVPPSRLHPKTPRDLETICLKCLQKEPAKRYQTAGGLADDLRRFLNDEPIVARPSGRVERAWRWCRRNPGMAGAGATAVIAMLAMIVILSFMPQTAVELAETNEAKAKAEGARAQAEERERQQIQRDAAALLFEQAYGKCVQDEGGQGLLWLARSLQNASAADAPDLERSIRTHLSGWSRHQHAVISRLTHKGWVGAVAFSPDGKTVLTGSEDGTAQLWATATGQPLGPPLQHQVKVVIAVAFSPDGKIALTGSADKTARLWDVGTGKPLGPPLEHRDTVWAVAFSPDGKTVLTGSEDKTAQRWDVGTRKPLGPPLQHRDGVMRVAFSPDGKTVLTGSADYTAKLWDVATGKAIGQPLQHQGAVNAVAFSPDAKAVLTGSADKTARLWEAETGKSLGPPLQHQSNVWRVAFSQDGRTVLTSSEDEAVRRWKAPAPLQGDPERLVLWTQVLTGMELDEQDIVRVLDAKTWEQRRKRLAELGGAPPE